MVNINNKFVSPKLRVNKNLKIPASNWEQFIEDFNGFGCLNMCQNQIPNTSTIELFKNRHAAKVYCKWCHDS